MKTVMHKIDTGSCQKVSARIGAQVADLSLRDLVWRVVWRELYEQVAVPVKFTIVAEYRK